MNERERQLDKRQLEPLFPCASITTVLGVFFFKVTSGVYTFVCVNPVSDHFLKVVFWDFLIDKCCSAVFGF